MQFILNVMALVELISFKVDRSNFLNSFLPFSDRVLRNSLTLILDCKFISVSLTAPFRPNIGHYQRVIYKEKVTSVNLELDIGYRLNLNLN